jgi:ribosomal protein S20
MLSLKNNRNEKERKKNFIRHGERKKYLTLIKNQRKILINLINKRKELVKNGDNEEVISNLLKENFSKLQKFLDKSVNKKIIHKNKSNRIKSRTAI